MLEKRLRGLEDGEVTLLDDSGSRTFGSKGPLRAAVSVADPRFYVKVVAGGDLGAAESYVAGHWSCDDLTALCRIFARNLDTTDDLNLGWARLTAAAARLVHWLHRNTPGGSGRNIHAHYDLGNEFFKLFLDPTMNYSCGVFESPESTMEAASIAKMKRVCEKLELGPGDHLLEIGTGWGGLAIRAAACHGCRVTTTTISRRQYEFAVRRVKEAGVSDRVTVLLQDYRDLEGRFDKNVSIEMVEAVGHEFLETYFAQCGRLLQPDGMMLLQGITMADHRYERYRRSVDFIQRFVFPGSCLPSVTAMCAAASRASDLRPAHLEDITPHYAETLRRWRLKFNENIAKVRALGYSDSFIRLWEYYLCYCEAGFEEGLVGDVQLLLTKPRRVRNTANLGALRSAA